MGVPTNVYNYCHSGGGVLVVVLQYLMSDSVKVDGHILGSLHVSWTSTTHCHMLCAPTAQDMFFTTCSVKARL